MKKSLISVLMVCALLLAVTLPAAAAGIDGTVELKDTNHTAWIDRLDLTHTDAAPLLAFYEDLREGADNDGEDDFLIDDHGGGYSRDIVTLTGSFTASSDNAKTEASAIGADALARYKPFVMAVYDAFDRDHPEVFWLSGERLVSYGISYNKQQDGTYSYAVTIRLVVQQAAGGANSAFDMRSASYPTAASIKEAISQRDAAVGEILSGVTTQSPYGILQYFNKTLTRRNEYNTVVGGSASGTAPADSWECISALLGRTGVRGPVCEGYARALKALCDRAGIHCVLVDGNAKTSLSGAAEAHMWCYVQVGESWYAIDVTWNDPVGGTSGAVSGLESEKWFLHGSDTVTNGMSFLASHAVNNKASVEGISFANGPVLSTTAYEDPSALSKTVLSEIVVANEAGEGSVTYGEMLTVTLLAESDEVKATDQTVSLYYRNVKLAESSAATDGVYRLVYNTLERKLPAGDARLLTLRFAGDDTMADAVTTVSVTLQRAEATVTFATHTHTVVYTGSAVAVPVPEVTLLGEDAPHGDALTYSYQSQGDVATDAVGLPTDVGVYRVTARFAGDDWYLGAIDELTLTVEPAAAVRDPSDGKADTDSGSDENAATDGAEAPTFVATVVTDWVHNSSLNTVMIVCAAVGGVCVLIPILFGRKKKEKAQKQEEQEEDNEDADTGYW